MEYMSCLQAGKWETAERWVQILCVQGRTENAKKSVDGRTKKGKTEKYEQIISFER